MCGCSGGWKGCEACAPSAAMISTALFRLCSASQSHAQRVGFENSNHLAGCQLSQWQAYQLLRAEMVGAREQGGDECCGLTFRILLCHPEGPVFSPLTAHSWGSADLSRLDPPQGTCGGTCSVYQKDTNDPCPQSSILVPPH